MTDVLVIVSALVGIAAGICTVLGYLEGHARGESRKGGGHRGRTLPLRKRMIPEGSGESAEPHGVEGKENERS